MLVLQGKAVQRQCAHVARAASRQGPTRAEAGQLLLSFSVLAARSAHIENLCIEVQTCSGLLGCWLCNPFQAESKNHTGPERFMKPLEGSWVSCGSSFRAVCFAFCSVLKIILCNNCFPSFLSGPAWARGNSNFSYLQMRLCLLECLWIQERCVSSLGQSWGVPGAGKRADDVAETWQRGRNTVLLKFSLILPKDLM